MQKPINLLVYEFRKSLDGLINQAYADGVPTQVVVDGLDIVRAQALAYNAQVCSEEMKQYLKEQKESDPIGK